MPIWIIYTILCLLFFGLWGFFSKMALDLISAKSTLFFQTIGIFLVTLCFLKPMLEKPQINWSGTIYATLTGVAFTLGSILFFLATKQNGKVSIVVTITALYPLVTIGMACLFLHEAISLKQGVGMMLAVGAMILLAT